MHFKIYCTRGCSLGLVFAVLTSIAQGVLPSSTYLNSPAMIAQYAYSSTPDQAVLTASGGLFAQPTSLKTSTTTTAFNCNSISLFSPTLAGLTSIIPGLSTTIPSCNSASLGLAASGTDCKWVPQTFLGMMYDRGVELLRHNVPQNDAFQVFEHARVMLLQYQVCSSAKVNADGSVNIPIAAEALYGYIFAKVHGKSTILSRTVISIGAEPYIGALRSSALSIIVNSTYYNSTVLLPHTVSNVEMEVQTTFGEGSSTIRDATLSSTDDLQLSDRTPENPENDSDCNHNAPSNTWRYRLYPNAGPNTAPLQNCCALACSALLQTIGVSPTMLMMDTCCIGCNRYSCDPANAVSTSALALQTVIAVPSLLNGYITTVNITL